MWQGGNQLASITDGGNTYSYTYNSDGLRTSKTVNGVTTEYYWVDNVLTAQVCGNNVMLFRYDADGNPFSFNYNGIEYFYVLNTQGDVSALMDASGMTVAFYYYDAWGNITAIVDYNNTAITSASHIVNINPIRYRGYYYDTEIEMYYLQRRYYSPELCRFISSDEIVCLDFSIHVIDTNLFVYCCNNPINYCRRSWQINYNNFYGGDYSWVAGKNKSGYDAIKKRTEIVTNTIVEEKTLYMSTILGQSDFIDITDRYACAVVALTNLTLYYYHSGFKKMLPDVRRGIMNNRIRLTALQIWSDTKSYFNTTINTSTNKKVTNSTFGGTNVWNARNGIAKYVKSRGYKCRVNTFWFSTYNDFKKSIKNEIPCILNYWVGNDFGHSILVVGYLISKDKNGNTYKYLKVCDGWDNQIMYFRFSDFDCKKNGYSVKVYK